MPRFILNRNTQLNGDNEVHNIDAAIHCLPLYLNQIDLGYHSSCYDAVRYAKSIHGNMRINGCAYCANSCHTT
jgi:predicted ATPase